MDSIRLGWICSLANTHLFSVKYMMCSIGCNSGIHASSRLLACFAFPSSLHTWAFFSRWADAAEKYRAGSFTSLHTATASPTLLLKFLHTPSRTHQHAPDLYYAFRRIEPALFLAFFFFFTINIPRHTRLPCIVPTSRSHHHLQQSWHATSPTQPTSILAVGFHFLDTRTRVHTILSLGGMRRMG